MDNFTTEKYMFLATIGYFFSSLTTWIIRFVIPLYLYSLTHSAEIMIAAYAIQFIPNILLSPFVGFISARFMPKLVLVSIEIIAVVLCMLYFVIIPENPYYKLIMLFMCSSYSVISQMVFLASAKHLRSIKPVDSKLAVFASIDSIVPAIGAICGALFMTVFTFDELLLVSAVIYGFCLICYQNTDHTLAEPEDKLTVLNTIKTGFTVLFQSKRVRFAVFRFFIAGLGLNCFVSIFVFFLKNDLALSDIDVGIVYSISCIGILTGGIMTKWININKVNIEVIFTLTGLSTAALVYLTAFVDSLYSVTLILCGINLISTINLVLLYRLRQVEICTTQLTNVVSFSTMLILMSYPFGSVLASFLITLMEAREICKLSGFYLFAINIGIIIFLIARNHSYQKSDIVN